MSEQNLGRVNERFESEVLEQAFEAAWQKCDVLSRVEAYQFVVNGYVVVKEAFSKELAQENCESAWCELESDHAIDRDKPESWSTPIPGKRGPVSYVRTRGTGFRVPLKRKQPRAFYAQTDVIGGPSRLPADGQKLVWGDQAIGNLGIEGDPRWQPPSPRQPGWHKDGWHFRHFLNSPEQGLLTVPLYSDIHKSSGGTYVAVDSLKPVARMLESVPSGLHPDSVQGAGYLIPGLIEQCSNFIELTGNAGDMVLLHPFMLHRVSINPTTRPRFIANMALVLKSPMQLKRRHDETYSLVELAILNALEEESLDYWTSRETKPFKPFPFRDEDERQRERKALHAEMKEMAAKDRVTPGWAESCGYMTNQEYAN